jgi:hypothetical protein
MTFTDDVAALTAQAAQLTADAGQAETDLQTAIDAIPDMSGLKAALTELGAAVDSVETLKAAAQGLLPTPTPEPAPAPAPAAAEPSLYTFSGDPSTIDATVWPASGLETAESTPRLLYTNSGDTAPGDTNGNGADGGAWVLYDGPTQPAPTS